MKRKPVPHVTLGCYNENRDNTAVPEALNAVRKQDLGKIRVDPLRLVKAPWSGGLYHLELVDEAVPAGGEQG